MKVLLFVCCVGALIATVVSQSGSRRRNSSSRRRSGDCVSRNGGWSEWGSWSECDIRDDMPYATKISIRYCNNPEPYCGGSECSGSRMRTEECSEDGDHEEDENSLEVEFGGVKVDMNLGEIKQQWDLFE
ncbi:A disintegrin and metalloproteinase with thrombospondin motifs adt-1-like [Bolinopsis microptera]|uniref:A disintegrin and metalloproteinase with thrombospondin motifs adt-1-like n=1 Tax=Bolinopsis microptera TaxID=2820187 RepID=UPI003079DBF1